MVTAVEIASRMRKKYISTPHPEKPPQKRVAVYARYSSIKQNDLSIEGQIREATEYCLKNDYAIVAQYVDQAKSGRSRTARAQFNAMMEDSAKGLFDIVLVYKFNRFFRNLNQQSICLEELKKNGVELLSIRDPIPDGRGGIYMRAIYGADAEAYSVGLSEDTKRGMLDAFREGKTTGMVPFGYTTQNRRRIIDPVNAAAVKQAFEMYADGSTMTEICTALKVAGIRNRYGNPVSVSALAQMLHKVDYMGVIVYKGEIVEMPELKIIEPDLFEIVQEKLSTRSSMPQRGRSNVDFLLTGKLFCGCCGSPMFGDSGKSQNGEMKYYYSCRERRKSRTCHKRSVPKEKLEKAVFNTAMQALTDENIALIAREAEQMSEKIISNTDKIRGIKANIRQVTAEIKNIGAAIAAGIITETTKNMLIEAEHRRSELEKELARQESIARTGVTAEEVAAWLMLFRAKAQDDKDLAEIVLRQLVQEVYVFDDPDGHKDGGYIITWLSLRKRVQITDNLFERSKMWGAKKDVTEQRTVVFAPFMLGLVGEVH